MINFLLFPIIVPFFVAMVLLFFPSKVKAQRTITMLALVINLVISLRLIHLVHTKGIQVVTLGSWDAPFGISMVSDMFSALLVTSTSIIALFVVWTSMFSVGIEREKHFYYPGILFLLTGVNGAFTTGDIFNMFVFFEVLLMASYLLIVLGGEKKQLRESIKYILVNVTSSALFVITVGYLYAVVGTLNMADISQKIAQVNQPGILTVIAVLFLVVFGFKSAIFPLFFWLPKSYAAPPIPVLALFGALLTKVGVYAIIRTYTLFFIHDTAFTHELLMILSIITIVFGLIGALAYFDVKQIIIYNIIIAVGVILFGASIMNETAMEGAIFYLLHDILLKGALFLLIGVLIHVTGTTNLRKMGGVLSTHPVLAWSYLIAAFGLVGIPPLSGFIGKLLIVKGAIEGDELILSLVILLSSLGVLLSVIRIFIHAFWGEAPQEVMYKKDAHYRALLVPAVIITAITVFYGVGAEVLMPYVTQATSTLMNPLEYIQAVLGGA
ncbi:Na+/H+ antiporter subunit D [Paenisporosarcina cavernae]|uniref:Na+/H+ antiporter subunit D n=1 Tax=Paenisporosarcina cavernae TaxID=2320858 RepID=A0A385YTY0_9BACL|nr:Na+/H+ antiporter subunit D [Paenisporosarcina cavernae]AYC29951.1 Na+/H+ antiporter subunit D [Paenisporosarcina cavernae]